jgi:hypothetical protein
LGASLKALATGPLEIGPFGLELAPAAALAAHHDARSPARLVSPGFRLVIPSLLAPGATTLADIKPPVPYEPGHFKFAIAAGLILLGIVAAMAGLARLLRRPPPAPPPPVPPEIEARRKIENLEREGLLEKGELKLFADRLSDILRHYLGRRYVLPAMAETTSELRGALVVHPSVPEPIVRRVDALLTEADVVKFAPVRPALGVLEALPAEALSIVDATTPAHKTQTPPSAVPGPGSGAPTQASP